MGVFSTPILNLLRVEELVIRADCDIDQSSIYSKNFEICNFIWGKVFKRYMEVERFVSAIVRDSRGLNAPAKIVTVSRWNIERSPDSPVRGGYSSDTAHKVYSDNSLIISHGRERFSHWNSFALNGFQRFTSTIPGTLHKRGRKIRNALTDKLVGCIMVIYLIPGLVFESPFCRNSESIGISSHSIEEYFAILARQPKLEGYRSKHVHIVGG